MDLCQNSNSRKKKNFLSTRKKMKILSAMNSDSRKCLCENESESRKDYENILEHGKLIMTVLKSEQYYVECLKQLKKCLAQPMFRGSIESLDDIIGLVEEMLSMHKNFYCALIDGKCDLSGTLNHLSSNMDTYVSYSILIDLELNNFQNFQKMCCDNEMNIIDLLHEPLIHIDRCKTLFENLYRILPQDMYLNSLRALENTSEKIKNASSVRKNAVRILQIQRLLVGRQPKILHPSRAVLKEGILYKVKCEGSGLKKRVFFLFNDVLLCCKIFSNTFDWCEKNSLLFCALFPLSMCSVDFVLGSSASNGAVFKVTCGTMSYLLVSKVPGESQMWVQELQTAIGLCQKLSSSELKPKLNRWRNIHVTQRISPFVKKSYRSSEKAAKAELLLKVETTNMSPFYTKASKFGKFVKFITCIKE